MLIDVRVRENPIGCESQSPVQGVIKVLSRVPPTNESSEDTIRGQMVAPAARAIGAITAIHVLPDGAVH